jgi:hypothetical protein
MKNYEIFSEVKEKGERRVMGGSETFKVIR